MINYKLIKEEYIEEIKSHGFLYEHQSGAKIIYMKNDDENKVFSATFKTPSFDNTGVAHIMEHCVLAGSRKYRVKEPFNELLKGSLYTYLNAMTFPDKTVYPIASCNSEDYFNLMNVYLDAVFFPLIYEREESFLQEGWHYEVDDNGNINYNGIVYNEMKGSLSDPKNKIKHLINKGLYNSTNYRFQSGGDPDFITNLSYSDFLNFHKKYYHPANCFIYFYGDLDIEKAFNILDKEYLAAFEKSDFKYDIDFQLQLNNNCSSHLSEEYDVLKVSKSKEQNFNAAGFILDTFESDENYYALKILSYLLLKSNAAPLKTKLLEKGVGKEIVGGFNGDLFQNNFTLIAKNSSLSLNEFQLLFIETLREIYNEGFSTDLIDAIFNKFDFSYRENDYGYKPKGLAFNLLALSSWLYGGDPFERMKKQKYLKINKVLFTPEYVKELLLKNFIDNNHIVFAELIPKLHQEVINTKKLNEKNDNIKKLKLYQESKDSEIELAKIPMIKVNQLNSMSTQTPLEIIEGDSENSEIIFCPLDTNGIIYTTMLFECKYIDENNLHYLSILSYILGKLSTEQFNYNQIGNRINLYLGNFSISINTNQSIMNLDNFNPTVNINFSCLKENMTEAYEIISNIINKTIFNDYRKLKLLLDEYKSKWDSEFLTSGNLISETRVSSYISKCGVFRELSSGIESFFKLKEILNDYENNFENIVLTLEKVCRQIFNKQSFKNSFCCNKDVIIDSCNTSRIFYNSLVDSSFLPQNYFLQLNSKNEGFLSSCKVQYNTLGSKFNNHLEKQWGNFEVISNIISQEYFMQEIRIKGGAYGYNCKIIKNGQFYLSSYRDPNLLNTYHIFRNVSRFINDLNINQREVDKYIIGSIQKIDKPLLPKYRYKKALSQLLKNQTPQQTNNIRQQIISANLNNIKNCWHIIENSIELEGICSIGNTEIINKNNEIFNGIKQI